MTGGDAGIASGATRRECSSLHPSNQPSPHRKEERPTVLGPYWIRQSRAVRGQTPMSTQSRCLVCGHHSCDIKFPKIDNSLNGTFSFSNREAWAEERLS